MLFEPRERVAAVAELALGLLGLRARLLQLRLGLLEAPGGARGALLGAAHIAPRDGEVLLALARRGGIRFRFRLRLLRALAPRRRRRERPRGHGPEAGRLRVCHEPARAEELADLIIGRGGVKRPPHALDHLLARLPALRLENAARLADQ